MADQVRLNLEKFSNQMNYFEQKEIFNIDEIRQIIKERENQEYRILKNSSQIIEFLKAIQYEMELENLRKKRAEDMKKLSTCHLDFQIVKRIINLFDRLNKKFRGNVDLVKAYLRFCIQIESPKLLYSVFSRNLKYVRNNLDCWLAVIYYEFSIRQNIFKARGLFERALAANKDNLSFWIQYMKFEFDFLDFVHKREQFVEQLIQKEQNQNKQNSLIINTESKQLLNLNKKEDQNEEMDMEIELSIDDYSEQNEVENEENNKISIVNKIDDFEWIQQILNQILQKFEEQKNKQYLQEISSLIDFLQSKQISFLEKYILQLKDLLREEQENVYIQKKDLDYISANIKNKNLQEFLNSFNDSEKLSLINFLLKKDTESQINFLVKNMILKINFYKIDKELIAKQIKNGIELLLEQNLAQYLIENKTLKEIILKNITNQDFFRIFLQLKSYFKEKDTLKTILKKIHNTKNMSQFVYLFMQDYFMQHLDKNILEKQIDFIIKQANFKKEILKIQCEFLLEQIEKNNKIFIENQDMIINKYLKLKNYCPVNIMVQKCKIDKNLQKKHYEQFLIYSKNDINIWKQYYKFLKDKADYESLQLLKTRAIRELNEEEKNIFQDYIKNIQTNQIKIIIFFYQFTIYIVKKQYHNILQKMYQKLDKEFLENWQYLSKEHIKNTRLVDLVIPGTHNSNTFTFDSYGSSFAQNQVWNIETQLSWGIRFLDLRYGVDGSNNQIIDKHGPISGKNYFTNFEAVKKFLDFHPNEFIVIKIQSENELNDLSKLLFKKLLLEKIGRYLITSEDKWFDLSKVTMNDIWNHSKRVYLVYHNYLTKYPNCDKIGLFCALERYQSFWHDTDDVDVLMEKNLDVLQKRREFVDFKNVLFSNQFVLTTQRGVGTIVSNIIVDGLPTINNLMTKLHGNQDIVRFILQNINLPYNIIVMDRIDQDPYLCLLIVILNFQTQLDIEYSFFKHHNITNETLPYVYNGRFLFIPNFCQFISEPYTSQKHFSLIYRYDGCNNMLYVRNFADDTLLIYDNPLVRHEYNNINAFVLFMNNQETFYKFHRLKNQKKDEKLQIVRENWQEYSRLQASDANNLLSVASIEKQIENFEELKRELINQNN